MGEVMMKKMKKEISSWVTQFLSRQRLMTDIIVKI
jgi:hypothetical protein